MPLERYVKFKIGNDYTSALGVWGTGYDLLNIGYYTTLDKSYATNIYGNILRLYGSSSNLGILINTDGNVGVGTITPSYKLDVNGVIRASEGVMVRNGSSDAIGFDTTGLFFNKAQESGSPIPASIFAFTWDSDSQKVVVSKDGNMIVTGKMAVNASAFDDSINAKLQVTGNIVAKGGIISKSNSSGDVTIANGNVSATNLYISTVVFGDSNNDAAIYVEGGHIKARNASGTIVTVV